jgi:hypothetical protein
MASISRPLCLLREEAWTVTPDPVYDAQAAKEKLLLKGFSVLEGGAEAYESMREACVRPQRP